MSCTSVYSSLFLLLFATTLTIFIMCGPKMATDGLPLYRQERGAEPHEDILAGADFLSVFISESSLHGDYPSVTTSPPHTTFQQSSDQDATEVYIRTSRQALGYEEDAQTTSTLDTSDSSLNDDGVIVSVSVSSSINSQMDKEKRQSNLDGTVVSLVPSEPITTEMISNQNFVAQQDNPSIVSKSSKSELNVDESDPITSDSELEFSRTYPANVQALPSHQHISFNPSSFLNEKNKPPFHHSVIYHDNPKEPGRARSVSYSTVIQAVPQTEKVPQHERKERNYDGSRSIVNNFEAVEDTLKNESKSLASVTRSANYYVTSRPSSKWEKPEQTYQEQSTRKSQQTSERNWEKAYTPPNSQHTTERNWEKPYSSQNSQHTTERNWEKHYTPPSPRQQLPKIYGRPEQNYEVDEAVSVVTNGRAHGLQPTPTNKSKESDDKKDDNQKVGYVVEGRDYRKYRVEERTADGFIVGEYGVVSHNDGSLRGVRYTADGTINPRLIYDALMKFLAL